MPGPDANVIACPNLAQVTQPLKERATKKTCALSDCASAKEALSAAAPSVPGMAALASVAAVDSGEACAAIKTT